MSGSSEKGRKPSRWFWVAFAVVALAGFVALTFASTTGDLAGKARYLWLELLIFIFGAFLTHLLFLDDLLRKRFKHPRIAIAFEIISGLAEIALALYLISLIRAQT